MKDTTKMLAFIGTTLLTWLLVAFATYLLTSEDSSYRDCVVSGSTLFIMVVFGWVPAVIVLSDLKS